MSKTKVDRVWIELEIPKTPEDAQRIADLANTMLTRLCSPEDGAPSGKFFWSLDRGLWSYGNQMGYRTLVDNGEWFSLTYFGRPIK